MAKAVRRDIRKMRAFLRFREVAEADDTARYVAWFEPEDLILCANAGFFVRRFGTMRWSILTPGGSLHWNGETLDEGLAAARADAPDGDPVEAKWKDYYAAIFNPTRLKTATMLKEIPKKYWKKCARDHVGAEPDRAGGSAGEEGNDSQPPSGRPARQGP